VTCTTVPSVAVDGATVVINEGVDNVFRPFGADKVTGTGEAKVESGASVALLIIVLPGMFTTLAGPAELRGPGVATILESDAGGREEGGVDNGVELLVDEPAWLDCDCSAEFTCRFPPLTLPFWDDEMVGNGTD